MISSIAASALALSVERSGRTPSSDPVYDNRKVYGSIGEVSDTLFALEARWKEIYTERFTALDNGGGISVDELLAQMQAEFSSYGVAFVSSKPERVTDGAYKVYIDEVNLRKMADDPVYRADNFALMRREFSGYGGFTLQTSHGLTTHMTSGAVFSLSEDNPLVGGSRYAGSGNGVSMTAGSSPVSTPTRDTGNKNRPVAQTSRERLEEWLEKLAEKRLEEKHKLAERLEQTASLSDGIGLPANPLKTGAVLENNPERQTSTLDILA